MEKICSECGYSNDQEAKFYLNCGNSFESQNNEEDMECPYCDSLISATAEKCKFCGEWVKKRQSTVHTQDEKNESHTTAIVIGYIISFLGGWFGIIIALYLLTRESKNAKIHGGVMLLLAIIMMIIWLS